MKDYTEIGKETFYKLGGFAAYPLVCRVTRGGQWTYWKRSH